MNPNALSVKALQEKIDKLESEVGERQTEINLAHEQRDAAVTLGEQKIQDAIAEQSRLNAEKAKQLADAEGVAAKGRALIASGEKQLAEARRMVKEAEEMDLGHVAIKDAKQALILVKQEWSGKLNQLQDGHIRRKFTELEKLRRRMVAKTESREYGTPEFRTKEKERREKEAKEAEHLLGSPDGQ